MEGDLEGRQQRRFLLCVRVSKEDAGFQSEAKGLMSTGTELTTEPLSSIFSIGKNDTEIANCRINSVKTELNHKMHVGVGLPQLRSC